MRIVIHPEYPERRKIEMVAQGIAKGGVYILPTDTVYAFCAMLDNKKAIELIYRLKNMPVNKPLSLYCRDFSQASEYIRLDDNRLYRWMKSNLPGPFTLILNASKKLPKFTLTKQRTVGIRIVSHPVISELLGQLDYPIIGTSVFDNDEYLTYPEDLDDKYGKQVQAIVDSGPIELELSTIIDFLDYPPKLMRQGKGDFFE